MYRFKTMLSTSVSLAILLMLGVAAFAQDGQPPDGPPPDGEMMQQQSPKEAAARELSLLSKRLKLTTDQKANIRPVLEDQHERMSALFQDRSGSTGDKMEKMKDIRDASNSKIRDLLTDDQKTQFDKIVQKIEQRPQSPPE